MAEIALIDTPTQDGGAMLFSWSDMKSGDTGEAVDYPQRPDKTITITGVFDGATVVIEGSNDGTNWYTLKDLSATDLSFTAASGAKTVLENTRFYRPDVSGGTGNTNINVIAQAV